MLTCEAVQPNIFDDLAVYRRNKKGFRLQSSKGRYNKWEVIDQVPNNFSVRTGHESCCFEGYTLYVQTTDEKRQWNALVGTSLSSVPMYNMKFCNGRVKVVLSVAPWGCEIYLLQIHPDVRGIWDAINMARRFDSELRNEEIRHS